MPHVTTTIEEHEMNNEILKLAEECGAYARYTTSLSSPCIEFDRKALQAFYYRAFQAGRDAERLEISKMDPVAWIVLVSGEYSHIRDTDPRTYDDENIDSESEVTYVPLFAQPPQTNKEGS
jgi:hypothetical protein